MRFAAMTGLALAIAGVGFAQDMSDEVEGKISVAPGVTVEILTQEEAEARGIDTSELGSGLDTEPPVYKPAEDAISNEPPVYKPDEHGDVSDLKVPLAGDEGKPEAVSETETLIEEVEVAAESTAEGEAAVVKKAVIRKKVIMRDAEGNEEIKETTEVIEGDAVDALDIEALTAADAFEDLANITGEVMTPKNSIAIVALNNGVTVDAGGASVTETVTPDGSTRLIRIEPEDGGPATLITISTE